MARYLDPKANLTFKKVFGEHPNLVASLLNSLLPLPAGEEIADIEYMSPERVPRTYFGKNSIVDVLCKTRDGRQFIVEMQMFWTADFKDRVLFNSAKVYVDQLEHGDAFSLLRPVYSLNLVDEIFEKDVPEFIHHYQMVYDKYTRKVIDGFHLVFVELPKFKPRGIAERKMAVLEEGEARGREKLLQTARNLKSMNLSNEQIAAATGFSAAEIENSNDRDRPHHWREWHRAGRAQGAPRGRLPA